jgi:S1-C subfamily serine protease
VVSRGAGEKWGLGIFSNLEIKSVASGSPADRAGLKKGEIIESVDGKKVNSLAPVLKALKVCQSLHAV